jgi:hypothetical protein
LENTSQFVGTVTQRAFGTGSKSEHLAVFLQTNGKEYVLRREGGNPFSDLVLEHLVGKKIWCSGYVMDYVLLISDWREIEPT